MKLLKHSNNQIIFLNLKIFSIKNRPNNKNLTFSLNNNVSYFQLKDLNNWYYFLKY